MGSHESIFTIVRAMATLKAFYQLIPSISFLVWYIALMSFGLYAVNEDWSIKESACGQTTHLMKFCVLNILFAFLTCTSFLLFPGGGHYGISFRLHGMGCSHVDEDQLGLCVQIARALRGDLYLSPHLRCA